MPLGELARSQVKGLLDAKRRDEHARNGVVLMKAALSALLSDAKDDGLLPLNPNLQLRSRDRLRRHQVTSGETQRGVYVAQRLGHSSAVMTLRPYAR